MIEANPRASRTVPFVSKATGVPLAKVGARVIAGASLGELRREGVLVPPVTGGHVSVKEAVLPFARFPDADTLLGPEMRSTGEVMGIDATFGLAFAKSQAAAGDELPAGGTIFFSLADRDKPGGVAVARRFVQLGFSIAATSGTAASFEADGVPVSTLVAKVSAVGRRNAQLDGGRAPLRPIPSRVRPRPRREPAPTPSRSSGTGRSTWWSTPPAAVVPAPTVRISGGPPTSTGWRASPRWLRPGAAAAGIADWAGQPAPSPQPAGVSRDGATAAVMTGRLTMPERADSRGTGTSAPRRPSICALRVGAVALANPVMTASGTSGHGVELAAYRLTCPPWAAVVVKSVSAEPWDGNPAPRLHPVEGGMLNSVGLQNPGVAAWLRPKSCPRWRGHFRSWPPSWPASGASRQDAWQYHSRSAAAIARRLWWTLAPAGRPHGIGRGGRGQHLLPQHRGPPADVRPQRGRRTAASVAAASEGLAGRLPLWVKLSPNVTDLPDLAAAAVAAGAAAVTLINTVSGPGPRSGLRSPSAG